MDHLHWNGVFSNIIHTILSVNQIFIIDWKHLYLRDAKRLSISSWEWFCSSEDFLRHSFTALLSGAELRTIIPISSPLASVPVLAHSSYALAKSCSIQHRRLTESDTLEER
jgi:hypothetical protein